MSSIQTTATATTTTTATATATATTKTTTTTMQMQHHQQLSPRANVFLLVNLGCEMLFVIDQRLKAQQIAVDKSIQVIHDITAVLLDPKFIDSLIVGSTHTNSQLITAEHCKFMLNDIAICSLMRLDEKSMDKLWNLMTMIFKWQLFVSQHKHHLLDITFRHLSAVGQLYPDAKRSMLVDFTKNTLLDFWNASGDEGQSLIYRTSIAWLQCFDTKISLLIRLGFQALDASYIRQPEVGYFSEFADTIGENIYVKSVEVVDQRRGELSAENVNKRLVDPLADLLNFGQTAGANSTACEDLPPIDACSFQKQFEQNLQQCNILFEDLDVNGLKAQGPANCPAAMHSNLNLYPDPSTRRAPNATAAAVAGATGEFVQLKPIYSRSGESTSSKALTSGAGKRGLNRELLDLYSKMY